MDRTELYLVSGLGIANEVRETKIPIGEGIYGAAARNGQIVVLNNVAAESKFQPIIGLDDGICSLLCIPLKVEEQVLGLINAYRFKNEIFDQESVIFLSEIANQIEVALENVKVSEPQKFFCITDPVTTLYNYRFFIDRLKVEFDRARRYKRGLTLLLLDIDHFKDYNNNCGLVQGDKLLKALSELFEKKVRKSDVVARYIGAEFVIILPETEEATAYILAERLRKDVEVYPFVGREKQPGQKITISIGIASISEQLKSADDLVKNTDNALTRAKEQGRNRISS